MILEKLYFISIKYANDNALQFVINLYFGILNCQVQVVFYKNNF
jgi:hypothetical protein